MNKKKRGRPSTGETRTYGYRIRLTEDEKEMLDYLYLSSDKKISRSDIIRNAIETMCKIEKAGLMDEIDWEQLEHEYKYE